MADETALVPAMGGLRRGSSVDRTIAVLAEGQHGVLSRAQLVGIGIGVRAIEHRIECGRLHRVHRGVYAVGHRVLSQEARWMAAALALGPGAVLSHRSAAVLWQIHPRSGHVDVTVGRRGRSRAAIEVHCALVAADERTVVRGIPVTTVARTIFDLAAIAPPRQVSRAMHEAEFRRLGDRVSLPDLLTRYPGRRGTAVIATTLATERIGSMITRSRLEERFRDLIAAASLPVPAVNVQLDVGDRLIEADCVWRAQRLVAELDGRAAHATVRAFEADRGRDRALAVAGWRTVRITWSQLHREPESVAADLRALLGRHRRGYAPMP